MDNWNYVRKQCDENSLVKHISQYSLADVISYLFGTFNSLQNILKQLLLKYGDQSSYLICQIIKEDKKLIQLNLDKQHPFVINLKLLTTNHHKKSQIYKMFKDKSQRLLLEQLFYQQQQHIKSIQFQFQYGQSIKKIKNDSITSLAVDQQINSLAFYLDQGNFIHINGPFSSGKMHIVQQYIGEYQLKELTLYLDETIDFNSLLGTFICTERVGEFVHKAGPLLHCANIGGVLILKNYQEASEDFRLQLRRALKSKFVIVGGDKVWIRNLKVIAISQNMELKNEENIIIKLNEIDKIGQMNILEQRLKINKLLLQYLSDIIDQLSPSLKNLIKISQRWQYHINKLYGNQDIQNNYLPEQLRMKLMLEVIDILQQVELNILQQIFQINLNIQNYNPMFQKYSTYIEMTKLGQVELKQITNPRQIIVYNRYSSIILEQIISCIVHNEPCLLVGDTGCGKTTLTQHCADLFNKRLFIYNLSEGSDAQDLIGGFRPLNQEIMVKLIFQKFLKQFLQIVDQTKNQQFVSNLHKLYQQKKYSMLLKCMSETVNQCLNSKKGNEKKLYKLKKRISNAQTEQMSFYFLTGNLIKAMKHGDWVLVDEINLANNELLQKILPAIEKTQLLFYERGDDQPIQIHKDFRLFGCMNPGTDVGKKELPINVKNKFTTITIKQLTDRADLINFVKGIIGNQYDNEKIVDIYQSQSTYSLRNLARALNYFKNSQSRSQKDMFDALSLAFGSGLNKEDLEIFHNTLKSIGLNLIQLNPSQMNYKVDEKYVHIYGFKLLRGSLEPTSKTEYIITPSNFPYLLSCLRCLQGTQIPILLEGPTSGGKTSLVYFLAKISGHKCHRINNHQNTEVEEYLGTYAPQGNSIQFQEGLLVQAIKNGDWIILDELNLARSEILENLNRLLDDNQELFLPETQTVLKPHPNFRLFATQNPISYSGRKQLSKAFRNRFIEIQVQEINSEDLTNILTSRCPYLPPTYIPLLKQTQSELNILRSCEQLFMQSSGMITLRDLIKWGSRLKQQTLLNGKQAAAMEGYCVIAERIREPSLKQLVKEKIEKIFKVQLDVEKYYRDIVVDILNINPNIQWNASFIRMAALTIKCVQNKEPALLIGPAGIGKTTLVELLSKFFNILSQHIVCHQYLEISDFVGSLRPVRQDEDKLFEWQDGPLLKCFKNGGIFLVDEVNMCPESVLEGLNSSLEQPPTLTVNDQFYQANNTFAIVAAMNPSGDWGKKELTPALRSRFTEIYAENPLKNSVEEIEKIVFQFEQNHSKEISQIIFQINQIQEITFRDLLQIIQQLKILRNLNYSEQYIVQEAIDFAILQQIEYDIPQEKFNEILQQLNITKNSNTIIHNDLNIIAHPYHIEIKQQLQTLFPEENLFRIIRALHYEGKPIMIQGMPSSGKAFLIESLAKAKNIQLVKIIFDEQSDLQELLGSDQPNSSLKLVRHLAKKDFEEDNQNKKSLFRFVDGPLLNALKKGYWIILKNLNLAPQNVLEGLNSILDHRKEIFIPELGQIIKVHENCRIFAIQNPMSLGEGRKGLPASFLNRFIRMHFQPYNTMFLKQLFDNIDDILEVTNDVALISQYSKLNNNVLKNKFYIYKNTQATYNHVDHSLWMQQKKHFSDLVNIIEEINCVFIVGPQGIGKRTLVSSMAKYCGKKLVPITLSKQTDSLELMGQYEQSTSKQAKKFGVEEDDSLFKWRFSQLVEAALLGYWVVVEDIDQLNKEILPKLVQFIENDYFTIFGEDIKINENFRLFMTSSSECNIFKKALHVEMNLENLNEIDGQNYNQDIQRLCDQHFHHLIGKSIKFETQAPQCQVLKQLKEIQFKIENIKLFDNEFSQFDLMYLNLAIKEQDSFWNRDIVCKILNENIELFDVYDENVSYIENQQLNHKSLIRRILNEHYQLDFKNIYLYCEYFTFKDQQYFEEMYEIIINQIENDIKQGFNTNITKLSSKQREDISNIQIGRIKKDLQDINFLIRINIIYEIIGQMIQIIQCKQINEGQFIVYNYIYKKLKEIETIHDLQKVLTKEIEQQQQIKMFKNIEEWEKQQIYDYLINDQQMQVEYFEIKELLIQVIEQNRNDDQLEQIIKLIKELLTKQQSQSLIKQWLQSIVTIQKAEYYQEFPILNQNLLLHYKNYLNVEFNIESLKDSVDFYEYYKCLTYQRNSHNQLDPKQSIKQIQIYNDYMCNFISQEYQSILVRCYSNPLKFYQEDEIQFYINYLRVKRQNQQDHTAQYLLLDGILKGRIIDIPFYKIAQQRYHHLKSLCFRIKNTKCLKQYNLSLLEQKIFELSQINEDKLIQMSSNEVQSIFLEQLVIEFNKIIESQNNCNQLVYGQFIKQNTEIIEQFNIYKQMLDEINNKKFIRNKLLNNIDATVEFLKYIISTLNDLIKYKQDQNKFKQMIEVWIIMTYDKYYYGFKDILKPIYQSLMFQDPIQFSNLTITNSGFKKQLISKNKDQYIQYATQQLINQEERDIFKMDDAKAYIQLSKKIKGMIVDQYTDEAVQKEKEQLEEIKDKELNTYKQEFYELDKLSKEQLTIRVKDELTNLDTISKEYLDFVLQNQRCDLIIQKMFLTQQTFNQPLLLLPDEIQSVDSYLYYFIDCKSNTKITNVYKQNYPEAVEPLCQVLSNLLQLITEIQKDILFTENEVLLSIGTLITHLLSQSAYSTPLIKLISGLDVLMQKIELWDSTVPKQYKLKDHCNQVIEFIIKWRRLERDGWKSILMNKIEELWCVESIILFKLLMTLEEQQINQKQIIDSYLFDCQLGNFECRIIMLNHIQQHIQCKQYFSIFQQKLEQAKVFYDQYNNNMRSVIQMYTKEVDEYRKLVSWDSKNYLIVQQASEKMHGKLVKVQLRFRNNLNEKFKQSIDQYLNNEIFDTFEGFIAKNKSLSLNQTINQDKLQPIHITLQNYINECMERIDQLKESKSNVKLQALRTFQDSISLYLGLKTSGSIKQYQQLAEEDFLLDIKPHEQLEKCSLYYYKSIYIIKQALQKQITKLIPANYLNKSVALIYDFANKLNQLFKLIRPLLLEQEQIIKQKINLQLFIKCFQNTDLETKLKDCESTTFNETKIQGILQFIQDKQLQFDKNYENKYHLLHDLDKYLNNSLIQFSQPHQLSQVREEQQIDKINIVWAKYKKALSEEEDLISNEIKILQSFNKYHCQSEKVGLLLKNLQAFCKLFYLMTVIFSNLIVNGFCQQDEETQEEEGEGELKDGTGIGEGKGQQNVTKEIEYEEQLVGEQGGEQQEEQQDQEEDQQKGDKEDEFDMQNEFDGQNKPVDNQEGEEQEEQQKSDVDEGFSSVEEDDPEMKQFQGEESNQEQEDEDNNDEKNRKKSDMDFNAEEQDQENQDLQAKKDEAEKTKDKKRNFKEFEQTSHHADSELEEESDLEEVSSEEKSEKDFGGKGGEQLEEIEQQEQEEIDEQQENNQEDQMDEEENEENEEEQIQEEDVKFNEPQQEDGEMEQEDVQDQELFNKQQIEEENKEQEEQNNENNNENQIFNDNKDEQLGEQGEAGQQGDNVDEENQEEKEDKKNNEKQNNTKKGNSKQLDKMTKKLFETMEQHLDQKEIENFKKDVNVQDDEGEEDQNQEEEMHYKINQNDMKIDKTTNLPIKQQQQQQQTVKESFFKDKIQEEFTEQEEQAQQQIDNNEMNGNQMNEGKNVDDQQVNENNENKKIHQFSFEIEDKQINEIDIEQLKQFYRNEHDAEYETDINKGLTLWYQIEKEVINNSVHLSEELKSILVATQVSALKGDFKTGKRLNMKKIIPYIASNFRKDKIWLRRANPQKRTYQIMLALDDSLSMSENSVGILSLQSLTSIALALSKMEAGQIAISSIHEGMKLLHDFNKPFSNQNCPLILGHYTFQYESRQSNELSLMRFMRESMDLFKKEKKQNSQQLCFIISDGKFNKKMVKPLVTEAEEQKILYVFIILDRQSQSIINIKSTNYVNKDGKTQIEIKNYLEDFPFKHYIIIKSPQELNSVLINILRQYYQLIE